MEDCKRFMAECRGGRIVVRIWNFPYLPFLNGGDKGEGDDEGILRA